MFRQTGNDVVDLKTSSFRQLPDEDVVNLAIKENRLIITHDKDFLSYMIDPVCRAKILLLSIDPQTEERMIKVGNFLTASRLLQKIKKSAIVSYRRDEIQFSFQ